MMSQHLVHFRDSTTPEQRGWIAYAMLFTGYTLLWRVAQVLDPGLGLTVLGLATFTVAAICYVNLLRHTPQLAGTKAYFGLIFAGGYMNFAALMANGGYMPAAGQQGIYGLHCPMDGASLVWLADWIWGFVSPGDVLMIAGAVGIVGMVLVRRRATEEV